MIESYFSRLEKIIQGFPSISTYTITKKTYNSEQGVIFGTIVFSNEFQLEFTEVIDTGFPNKLKYRYHLMDQTKQMIFRYDNAPHHKEIKSFPHHKHTLDNIVESNERSLLDVVLEILNSELC
jgi:hypothetical protein